MNNLSLFNIGFRCENICQAFKKYKESNTINKYILNDSSEIINDCFSIKKSDFSYLNKETYNSDVFIPIIVEYFKKQNKSLDEVINSLSRIQNVIEQTRQNKSVDLSEAEKLFNDISEICLSKSSQENNNANFI